MNRVYRICKAKYVGEAFSGNGGLYASGRWHHRGVRIVYTAQNLSLAALEYFVHLGRRDTAVRLYSISADLPDGVSVEVLDPASLPKGWNLSPPVEVTQNIGTQWCRAGRSAVLRTPSVLVPGEYNYILNPLHRDFARIQVHEPEEFQFDPRMWK